LRSVLAISSSFYASANLASFGSTTFLTSAYLSIAKHHMQILLPATDFLAIFSEIKNDCEKVLAEAMPALKKALAALDTLNKADIGEMKNYA
jgi:hypothetical protein